MTKKLKAMKTTGIVLTTAGATILVCLLFFRFFGNSFLSDTIEFEADQTIAENTSSDTADYISVPGFESLTIDADSTDAEVDLYNPDNNECYFEISIILPDTGEELYKSKYISPGQHLYSIELNTKLEKGEYDAVLHYSTYSLEDYSPLNGANIPFTLTAE